MPPPLATTPSEAQTISTLAAERTASMVTTMDGTQIYYKDWGKGPVVTFSHGWPLNADAWEAQMLFLAQNGYRAVAHDRRGHGRSNQASSGNDMNTYADDLAAVIEALGHQWTTYAADVAAVIEAPDLQQLTMVGHSPGGGEGGRYVGGHGMKRVARAVLVSAVPPLMLKAPANTVGLPIDVFDGLRNGLL